MLAGCVRMGLMVGYVEYLGRWIDLDIIFCGMKISLASQAERRPVWCMYVLDVPPYHIVNNSV